MSNHHGRAWQCYLSPDEDERVRAAAVQLVQAGRLERNVLSRGHPIRYRIVKSLLLGLADGHVDPSSAEDGKVRGPTE